MSKEYDFLKKQRYEYYKGTTEIMDNEVNDLIKDVVDVLNQKDCSINELIKIHQHQAHRIAELELQLKNAIVPKFKVGQTVWYFHIARNKIYKGIVEDIQWRPINGMYYSIPNLQRDYFWIRGDELFATKEEAEAKLQELKGE